MRSNTVESGKPLSFVPALGVHVLLREVPEKVWSVGMKPLQWAIAILAAIGLGWPCRGSSKWREG